MPEPSVAENLAIHRDDRGIQPTRRRDDQPVRRILVERLGQLIGSERDLDS